MNLTKHKALVAEIANLTVAQAHKAFFRAIEDGNTDKADTIRVALRLASAPLREALDYARARIAKAKRGKLNEASRNEAEDAERNLIRDLDRITEVLHWQPTVGEAPKATLGDALAKAGLRATA
jgi:hypothetical protein